MLDLSHPRTGRTFQAGHLECRLRAHLVDWKEQSRGQTGAACSTEVLTELLPGLRQLNSDHFKSAGIDKHLDAIDAAVRNGSPADAWSAFVGLAESGPGDNFGTWAI